MAASRLVEKICGKVSFEHGMCTGDLSDVSALQYFYYKRISSGISFQCFDVVG